MLNNCCKILVIFFLGLFSIQNTNAQNAAKGKVKKEKESRLVKKARRHDRKSRKYMLRTSKGENSVGAKTNRKKQRKNQEKAAYHEKRAADLLLKAGQKKHLRKQTGETRKRMRKSAKKHKQHKQNSRKRTL